MVDYGGELLSEVGGRERYPEIDAYPESEMGSSGQGESSGRVRYPEIDASSEIGSSREAVEEPRRGIRVEYDKIFVALGKEVKENKSLLIWALQNSKGKIICITHVQILALLIPMPMGGKFPAHKVGEKQRKAFREKERLEMLRIIDEYLQICAKVGVRAENISIEANSIEEGIVEVVSQHKIGRLVMGAASDSRYSRKMIEPKSKKANYVRQNAPDYCQIWFVCKGRLIHTREGVKQSNPDSEASNSNQSVVGAPSPELDDPRLRLSDFSGHDGIFSPSSGASSVAQSAFSSPRSSFSVECTQPGFMVLPQTPTRYHDPSPPGVLQESGMNDPYHQLQQAISESENSKREAFEESMKRRKAEKDAVEAIIHKANLTEGLYKEELRRKKEIEEELAKGKEELENAEGQRDKLSLELNAAIDERKILESQIEELNATNKGLEEKIFSAVNLLQKYREEHEALQLERDKALQKTEHFRNEMAKTPSNSNIPVFFSNFSFSDIERATNSFDPSLKIGEGGYGTIYKGFLRHTEVAIKILNPDSMQGPKEFQQEVDVLSKLRHRNLVTLIGACPESWALIYEYLDGGSLEDRLNCKSNSPPLSWQTRIRIATELCSVLIFLHSIGPNSIIHGDLKPSNILLDENSVCKLSDFGICRLISSGEMSMEKTTRFFTSEPRGTFSYMDPEFLATGEITTKSDVYSFGIILLRLLTGKPALGIAKLVQYALDNNNLNNILDPSAGDWPFVQAEQLARMGLRCCEMNQRNRPELASDVWRVLEPIKASCRSLSTVRRVGDDHAPFYFICPIFQEVMQDPHIGADGFTYEAEAIKGWLDSGHDTSPMTNVRLENHNLVPNRALRSAIQEWLQLNHVV